MTLMNEWKTVIPIWSFYRDDNGIFKQPVEIGDGIKIIKAPPWFSNKGIKQYLGRYQKNILDKADFCIVREYEADALGEVDTLWKGERVRSKQETSLEKIMVFNLALWLAKPSCIGFELMLHCEKRSEWMERSTGSFPRLIPHERDKDSVLDVGDLNLAKEYYNKIINLPRNGSVWIATHVLWSSLTQRPESWEMRYLLLWIALESLFGSDNEIAHRMSERIAFFLANERDKARKIYTSAKNGYKWRSKIVHGMRLSSLKDEDSEQVLYDAECFIRESLVKILKTGEIAKVFDGNEREEYLNGLIFA